MKYPHLSMFEPCGGSKNCKYNPMKKKKEFLKKWVILLGIRLKEIKVY